MDEDTFYTDAPATFNFDLSKAAIITDESMVDEHGNSLNYVNIQDEHTLVCHPSMKEKLEQAIELFFNGPFENTTVGMKQKENNEGGQDE